ncbi:hypothetical protein TSOC_012095 [Tetrabaena socialis]|uniref:Uncharacterized protein n=1 Tax=Tetrabaena socialis TaxID=47790 RepID=A0A2J7ZNW4_9CHLO|nr:hypothetical protein TSOC_012095 [Tetrabaena socialis]|eukprot:PNH01964.1 hypothetical protein TSOC_012095 [Tetrabaena socialis]
MAAPQRRERRAEDASARREDSVDDMFDEELSEASRDVIRSLGRRGKRWGDVEDSERAAAQPPSQAECDRASQWVLEKEEELKSLKKLDIRLDARERQWVDYKRALTQGASAQELAWLKLKAYHAAVDALRASRGEDAAGNEAGAPKRELPRRSPWWGEAQAALQPTLQQAARPEHQAMLRAARDALPSSSLSSEEASDEAQPDAALCLPAPDDDRLAALQAAAFPYPSSAATSHASAAPLDAASSAAAASAAAAARGVTRYRADYLEELALGEQLAAQRQQRSAAFALGLAAAVGFSLLRRWLRRGRGGAGGVAPRRRQGPASPVAQ